MEVLDYDYLIVGQGIAGTCLAIHLIDLGKKVLVVNDSTLPSSSKVAAGIFNPLTGKKLVKTWLADDLFPFADLFYNSLEGRFGVKFVHKVPIYRPFRSIEEQNTYLAQTANPAISPYISNRTEKPDVSEYIHSDYDGLEVVQSGWIDLPVLLESARSFFQSNGSYLESAFQSDNLKLRGEFVEWNGMKFGKSVLCQGFEATLNPLFGWLPFAPVKGEILEIATKKVLKACIINQGIFILPLDSFSFRLGATYSWDNLNWNSTEAAREELEGKLKSIFKGDYSVTGQSAGIRPSSNDRRPMIGVHPEYSNVVVFNGLGTKGVTLAPFFANELAEHLENGKELNSLVNIKRYFSLYFR